MIFTTGKIYREELALAFGALAPSTLAEVLRDGRPSSCLLHAHLLAKFSNLRQPPTKATLADCVMDTEDRVFQVRAVTEHGVTLLPAKSVGVGREYDAEAYRAALKILSGFILMDVTEMPRVTYAAVVKDILPFQAKFTRQDALALLKLSEHQP